MTINWNIIWMNLFERMELFGTNTGFWTAMTVTGLIVILVNVVFWTRKRFYSCGDSSQLLNPLESSFLIRKAMRFNSKGRRVPDVISDNYEKLAPSADIQLRVNCSGIQQRAIMRFLHI